MEKSIRVNILGREYSLRVNEQDVDHTLEIATYLDTKMRAFREAHPNQHEVTTAVITGLASCSRCAGPFPRRTVSSTTP